MYSLGHRGWRAPIAQVRLCIAGEIAFQTHDDKVLNWIYLLLVLIFRFEAEFQAFVTETSMPTRYIAEECFLL